MLNLEVRKDRSTSLLKEIKHHCETATLYVPGRYVLPVAVGTISHWFSWSMVKCFCWDNANFCCTNFPKI